jgi:lipocalin
MDMLLGAKLVLTEPLDLFKYSGAWYEVASHKAGFFGLNQYDCMDTRGIYEYNPDKDEIDVQTQCRHINRRISGVKAIVKCPQKKGFPVECSVRFPNAPFIPNAIYRILDTDYESYALIEGSNDKSFVQIYSRYSRPGLRFIEQQKERLKAWGYDPDDIHITPVTIEKNIEM